MADEPLIYGLARRHYADLDRIFARHPQIERVLIYGSRAKGTARPESDFDLAVVAPAMSDAEFSGLWDELDALPLVFKLDVLHWDRLNQEPLKQAVMTQGRVFWPLAGMSVTRSA